MGFHTDAEKLKTLIAEEDEKNVICKEPNEPDVTPMGLMYQTSAAMRIFLEAAHMHEMTVRKAYVGKNICSCMMCSTVKMMIAEFG